jgi:uncharacterized membrane protein
MALFKFGIRINLRTFFFVMGVLLLLIIAGLAGFKQKSCPNEAQTSLVSSKHVTMNAQRAKKMVEP